MNVSKRALLSDVIKTASSHQLEPSERIHREYALIVERSERRGGGDIGPRSRRVEGRY